MLILEREKDQKIRIRTEVGDIWITVVRFSDTKAGSVKLGIDAPIEMDVTRLEVLPPSQQPCTLRPYRTEGLAREAIAKMRRRGRLAPHDSLEPFVCARCGLLHNRRVSPDALHRPVAKLRA